ncbi:MAG: flavin reductase family protein [Elusimicrobiota bacterium]|jgi:flavin reductase (DIM6/NTAB) family NADH-FMN oxidoreductase RutF|nr:flavin reductase family protein [Elusimicrobiota bacterium]
MKKLPLEKVFLYLERGPVVLVVTNYGGKNNIMTITWTGVKDFDAQFFFTTGNWNYSYKALLKNKECIVALPAADLAKKAVQIGSCSGADTDKFSKFALTPLKAEKVSAPLIKECFINIECKVIDYVKKHNLFVLQGIAAHIDEKKKEKRLFHAIGDGTFVIDGAKLNFRKIMKDKLPFGV